MIWPQAQSYGTAVVDGIVQEESPTTMILPMVTNEEVGVSLTYQF